MMDQNTMWRTESTVGDFNEYQRDDADACCMVSGVLNLFIHLTSLTLAKLN
jgi:hypothetical protein